MKLLWTCIVLIVIHNVTPIHGQENTQDDDASFQKYLNSFLGNLFGGGDTTTAAPQGLESQTSETDSSIVQSTLNPDDAKLSESLLQINATMSNVSLPVDIATESNNASLSSNADGLTSPALSNNTQPISGEEITSQTAIEPTSISVNNPRDPAVTNGAPANTGSPVQNDTQFQQSMSTIGPTTYASPSSTTSWYKDESDEEFDSACYRETAIQDYCSAPSDLQDVSFWDLYAEVFSDSVLDGLIEECMEGTWCLQDKYDYWDSKIVERVDILMNSEVIRSMCQPGVLSCIDNMANFFTNCTFHYMMVFTSEALDLVCNLKFNEQLTDQCYKHVIEALHVTLADRVRTEQGLDVEEQSDDTCDSPEAHMTQGLICITNSCPGEGDTFKSFRPWAWFTAVVDDLITECDYNISECIGLLQVGWDSSVSTPPSLTTSDSTTTTTPASALFTTSTSATTAFWQWLSSSSQGYYDEESSSGSATWGQTQDFKKPANYIEPEELQMMITISTATMVTAVFLSLTVCLCYRRYRRNAVIKDGYQKLLSEGDES